MRYFLPFPHNGCPSFYSKQKYRILFSLQPWKHLTFVFFNTILFNRHRFLYDFSLHFLMTDDTELFFFMYLLGISTFLFENRTLEQFVHFLKVLAIFLLWSCLSSPCILNITYKWIISSWLIAFFVLKMKSFSFVKPHLSVFPLVFYT